MLPVILENLVVVVTGLGLLIYLGAGVSYWLPLEVAPYRLLAAPWVGYCLLVIITQFLTNLPTALTSFQSAYVALALATIVNAYALWRWTMARRAGVEKRAAPVSETAWVWALALLVLVLCVLPLWSYGYTTIIGENWDAEIYMGLGEYLKAYPQVALTHALPNPILDTLINPPYSLRTHGFSYFQAALGFLPLDSLRTLAPLLALVRAMSIPAAYLFFRLGLRFKPPVALLACLALALNPFLLWVTYNTFGMQVPAFGLLPLCVCFTLLALRVVPDARGLWQPSSPVWWAGLVVAGIAVTYHPALTAYIAMAGPVALVIFLFARGFSARARVVASVVAIGVVGIVLSLVSQLKSFEGFLKQYSEKVGGLGLTGFTSPADAFGFSLSFRDLVPADPGRPLFSLLSRVYSGWGWVALAVALGLVAYYLWKLWAWNKGSRLAVWEQMALIVGAAIYVLLFLKPLNYPYGWFKALTFVSFVLIAAGVAGLVWLFGVTPLASDQEPPATGAASTSRVTSRLAILPPVALGLVLLVPLLATLWLTVGMYWGQPLRFDSRMIQVGDIRPLIMSDPNRSTYISNSPNMQKLGRLYNGLLSYFLRDTNLYGDFQTANSKLDRLNPNGVYQYVLLNAADSPSEYGVDDYKEVWHNPLMALYASTGGNLYHHNYRDDGRYPEISPGKPLTFAIGPASVEVTATAAAPAVPSGAGGKQGMNQFSLGLSSFTTSILTIDDGQGSARQYAVPPGYTMYTSPAFPAGSGNVRLSVSGGDRVFIRWAHLARTARTVDHSEGISSDGAGLIATVNSSQQGNDIALDVGYLNNRPESAGMTQTLSLDIYGLDKSPDSHFGYWNFDVPYGQSSRLSLKLDPSSKSSASAMLDGKPISPDRAFTGTTGDGRYVGSLLVYENGQVSETFNDIFTFTIKDGKLADFKPRSLPPLFR